MSLSATRDLSQHDVITGEDAELAEVEALSDLLTQFLIYYKVASSAEEREYAKRMVWGLVTKWVEMLGPVKYIPGLIDEVSSIVRRKLWDVDEIPIDELRELLVTVYLLNKADVSTYITREDLERISTIVETLLTSLGYCGDSILVEEVLDSLDPSGLVSLSALAVILATNH